jgi:hypothetical protein
MVLKYHISPSALSENFIVRIWEAASDGVGAHIYEQTILAPHAAPVTITVNGLDRVVHIVRMYGATSAVLLHEYNVEPTTSDIVTVFDPIRFKIGDGGPNTPAAGTSVATTPELAGLVETDFLIFRANYGPLFPTTHFTFNTGDGSWELNSPDIFNGEGGGEEFTIVRLPKAVTGIVNDSVVGKWFAGFVDVSSNTSYVSTHLRKLIRFSGSPEYTFSGSIPIGYVFCFQHFGSTGTAKVNFTNGTLLYAGTPKASIDIPRYTEAAFVWDGTNWNVVYMTDSDWVNGSSTPTPGTVLGIGRFSVGDVPAGDPVYTITHNLAISGDYMIIPTIETNTGGDYTKNNKVGIAWHHHATDKANKVYVTLQEISGETQSQLYIAWVIIKR